MEYLKSSNSYIRLTGLGVLFLLLNVISFLNELQPIVYDYSTATFYSLGVDDGEIGGNSLDDWSLADSSDTVTAL